MTIGDGSNKELSQAVPRDWNQIKWGQSPGQPLGERLPGGAGTQATYSQWPPLACSYDTDLTKRNETA